MKRFLHILLFLSFLLILTHAAAGCADLALPENLIVIEEQAFIGDKSLCGALTIPEGVTSIGAEAFAGCTGLTSLESLPEGCTMIGARAFAGCSNLEGELYIPNDVQVGDGAFDGCDKLTILRDNPDSPFLYIVLNEESVKITGTIYGKDGVENPEDIPRERIPDKIEGRPVTHIADNAFKGLTFMVCVDGELYIPDTVTTIGDYAFWDNSPYDESDNAVGVLKLPQALESIGDAAFAGCSSLTGDLIIPDSVSSIGAGAFNGCRGFNGQLKLPAALKKISRAAFYNCSGLSGKIVIPKSVKTIGEEAFYGCRGFTGIPVIPEYAELEADAFSGCSGLSGALVLPYSMDSSYAEDCFKNIPNLRVYAKGPSIDDFEYEIADGGVVIKGFADRIPDGMAQFIIPWEFDGVPVTKIAEGAFVQRSDLHWKSGSSLGFALPDTITEIEEYAFFQCFNLKTTLHLPKSLVSLGESAFGSCAQLTGSLVIPDSVKIIGDFAFSECNGLNGTLTLGQGLESIGYEAFYNCFRLCGDLIIPDSVRMIDSGAFDMCVNLNGTLSLGAGLETIGSYAFGSCKRLTGDLVIPDSVTSIDSGAFYGCEGFAGALTLSQNLTYIGPEAFENCKNLTGDLAIPEGVTCIEADAFYSCSGLNGTLTLPSALESIDWNAFAHCSGLTGDLSIPDSVTMIADGAFKNCSGFNGTLSLPENLEYLGEEAFYNCNRLTGDLVIAGSVDTIYPNTFFQCYSMKGSLTLPEGLLEIGYSAFESSGFTGALSLPGSLTAIGENAFKDCRFTGKLVLPDSLEYIGESAFRACSGLTGDLNIPASVTELLPYAFYGCENLDGTLTISGPLKSIGEYAFSNCGFTGTLALPAGMTAIGGYAFSDCRDLMNLKLPDTLVSIGDSAFRNCIGLTGQLSIPSFIEVIGPSAFRNCLGLNGVDIQSKSLKSVGDYAFRGCTLMRSTVVVPDAAALGQGTFDESDKMYILHQSMYDEARAQAETMLVGFIENVMTPDTLFSTMKDESITFFDHLVNTAQDIIHGDYDNILFKDMKKEAYLFNQFLLANQNASTMLLNPLGKYSGPIKEILDCIQAGAKVREEAYFEGALKCSGVILFDGDLEAAREVYNKYLNRKISFNSLADAFKKYNIESDMLALFLDNTRIFNTLKDISDVAVIADIGFNAIDVYNRYALLSTLDEAEVLKAAEHYMRSEDDIVVSMGKKLHDYYNATASERINTIIREEILPDVLNETISFATDAIGGVNALSVAAELSSFVIDGLTGVDAISRLTDELQYSVDMAQSTYLLFEEDYSNYMLTLKKEHLIKAATAYMLYCTAASQSQDAFLALYEQVDSHLAGAFITDEVEQLFADVTKQRDTLAKMANTPRGARDFLEDNDFRAFLNAY